MITRNTTHLTITMMEVHLSSSWKIYYFQSNIFNLVKHLWWSFFAKIKSLQLYSQKSSIIDTRLGSKYVCFYLQTFFKNKLYGPFLWMGFNCLKAAEPLLGDSFLFTTTSPGVSGTHLIVLVRMKGRGNLGASQWFQIWDPWLEIQRFNHSANMLLNI